MTKQSDDVRKALNVALVGQGFMGKTHSNAWSQVGRFFELPRPVVMHSLHARDAARAARFAADWGWRQTVGGRRIDFDPAVELVDIVTPNNAHADYALAALASGHHVACEKPIADTLDGARAMAAAARKAAKTGIKTFVWYNYRRCPAVALAHRLVRAGRIGRITRICAWYLQDWATPEVPLAWRFRKDLAGGGSMGDLTAHVMDMTRFVSGLEVAEICGAAVETFVKRRPVSVATTTGGLAAVDGGGERKMGKVTVDDTAVFIARFAGGALGTFESARQATGNLNRNGFEINGDRGAVRFDFERMNELEFCDATGDRATYGWTTINCSHAGAHDYAEHWWPDAHPIGYEHTFTNMAADIATALSGGEPTLPLPDFEDAYQTQRVLEAAFLAARERRAVKLSEVK